MSATIHSIMVYLDNGVTYTYEVEDDAVGSKVREHCAAITANGYRHNDGETFVCYPAWRILKVAVHAPIATKYPDKPSGT